MNTNKMIKLRNVLAMMLMAMTVFSCSSDDDNTPAVSAGQAIAGTYSGYSSAAFSYSPNPIVTPNEELTIIDKGDNTVDLTFKSGQWGTYELKDVAVSVANKTYTVKGEGEAALSMAGPATTKYQFELNAVLTADKKVSSCEVKLPAVMGGTTISFIEGTAPVAQVVAGSYAGNIVMSVNGSPAGTEAASVKIAAEEGAETVKITFPAMGSGAMEMQEFSLTGVELSTSDYKTYTFSSKGGENGVEVVLNEGTAQAKTYCVKLNSGTIVDGKLSLAYDVKPGAMPFFINFTFESATEE